MQHDNDHLSVNDMPQTYPIQMYKMQTSGKFHMHAIIYSQLVAAANAMVHCITVKVATQIVYISTAIIVTSLSTSAPAQAN